MGDLTLSPKYGLNSSLELCYYCYESKGSVIQHGLLPHDAKAPLYVCVNEVPCDNCAELMQTNILFISADPKKTVNPRRPWRTGRFAVLSEDRVKAIVTRPETLASMLRNRYAFVDEVVWNQLLGDHD